MKLNFLNFLALLLISASSLNWQSAGNMSSQNMTVINSYIKANFTQGAEIPSSVPAKAIDFSNYLNGLWAQAWNVVIIVSQLDNKQFDAVVYGYAFRDHWLWINGYLVFDGSYPTVVSKWFGSFIIWKDYNCLSWVTINTYGGGKTNTFSTEPTAALNAFFITYPAKYDDIWNIAWKAVTYLETEAADFKGDHAYTMIVSQAAGTYYMGKVCASDYNVVLGIASDPTHGNWGSYLILKMR